MDMNDNSMRLIEEIWDFYLLDDKRREIHSVFRDQNVIKTCSFRPPSNILNTIVMVSLVSFTFSLEDVKINVF